MPVRQTILLRGIVQGVGMRPALYRMAVERNLAGSVCNTDRGVALTLYGEPEALDAVYETLGDYFPPAAVITEFEMLRREPAERAPQGFTIEDDPAGMPTAANLAALPDAAPCEDCRRELRDPADRRYRFAFNGCGRCGVRASAIADLPYRRAATAWKKFPLCPSCRREYADPADRRFHIEGISCPVCGPKVRLLDDSGVVLAEGSEAVRVAARLVAQGGILALKGVGGFQLLANPADGAALARLRAAKHRPDQPLALMIRDEAALLEWTTADEIETACWRSPAAPIVLLRWRNPARAERFQPALLAPDGPEEAGFMRPASPLHELFMMEFPEPVVVATSGNDSGEAPALDAVAALAGMRRIADCFLVHDRDILWRHDDSLAAENGGAMQLWRRARGYSWQLPACDLRRPVLAAGGELKNAFAAGATDWLLLSPYHGKLESSSGIELWKDAVRRTLALLPQAPEVLACDLHPDYHASIFAHQLAAELQLPLEPVPHHYAHALAALAEFGMGEALALVCDGTGLGPDGTLWGGELLYVSRASGGRRLGCFQPAPLPGGEAAIRDVRRQALARAWQAGVPPAEAVARYGDEATVQMTYRQCEQKLNAPLSSAAGRLFDAFAAHLGIAPEAVTYEGQAAIRLEQTARRELETGETLPYELRQTGDMLTVDWSALWREDWRRLLTSPARAFHRAVAASLADLARFGLRRYPGLSVLLTGGVMQNRLLVEELAMVAPEIAFRLPLEIPVNDGGIAVGQILWAGLHFKIDGVHYEVRF